MCSWKRHHVPGVRSMTDNNNSCCCCSVAQSCLTLCYSLDWSPPGSSVHGILQERILEWVAISFSRGFLTQGSNPRLLSPALQADSLPAEPSNSCIRIFYQTILMKSHYYFQYVCQFSWILFLQNCLVYHNDSFFFFYLYFYLMFSLISCLTDWLTAVARIPVTMATK